MFHPEDQTLFTGILPQHAGPLPENIDHASDQSLTAMLQPANFREFVAQTSVLSSGNMCCRI